jgi:hypothetical protein
VPVLGRGAETTEGRGTRVSWGRPNWWVILAVSLALMALLVAVAGTAPHASRGRKDAIADAPSSDPARSTAGGTVRGPAPQRGTAAASTVTTVTGGEKSAAPAPTTTSTISATTSTTSSVLVPHAFAAADGTTTTEPPATTTTVAGGPLTPAPTSSGASDDMQTQGYLDPPLQTSNGYGFTGTGDMEISVVWSGSTYLTMAVSCPSGSQTVGGTSAMAASLPDATGSCRATVSEPSSESVSLTYTITIGPANV